MSDLVFLENNQALTTSLKVAEYFEKRHDRVLRAISTSIQAVPKNGDSAKAFIKSIYKDESGKSNPMYLLNRDGFMFVVMGFTGEKAARLKWNYIQAFNAMEETLRELLVERKSEQWREIRNETKQNYRVLTAAVQKLYDRAKSQGSKATEKSFYVQFAKLINKTLNIKAGSRDKLALWQLYEIDKLQFIAKTIIEDNVAKGDDYHLPYRVSKTTFEEYAQLSRLRQRMLLA